MPKKTIEQLGQRESKLKEALADKGKDPVKQRSARKKLRRTQRLRRRLAADAKRRAGKTAPAEPAS